MSRNPWTRVAPDVAPMGDIGGDDQVSEAYGARFWRPLADGRFAVIDRSFYVADHGDGPVLECQTEYLICRDWQRPGDTEDNSDARSIECEFEPTVAEARKQAELLGLAPFGDDEWGRIDPWAVLA